MVGERTGPHSAVKLSGFIPPLAESFHQRPETGLDLRAGLYPGDTVVLTHGEETASAPTARTSGSSMRWRGKRSLRSRNAAGTPRTQREV